MLLWTLCVSAARGKNGKNGSLENKVSVCGLGVLFFPCLFVLTRVSTRHEMIWIFALFVVTSCFLPRIPLHFVYHTARSLLSGYRFGSMAKII